jgi:undecaprenyl-diphosphatase
VTTNTPSKAPQWTKGRQTTGLAGLAGFTAAALLFGVLIVAVRVRWLPLESIDRGVAADLNRVVADHPALVSVLKVITLLGSHGVLGWLVAITTLILLVRRRWRLAAYLLVTSAGGLILDPTLKIAVGRLRPVVADPIAAGGGNSFPSGHALASIIGYGALLLVFTPALPRRARKPVIIALAAIVVLVGFSRLALGVHYLSDILGAWCLGIAWLGATAYAFELWRKGSGERVTAPLTEGLEPEASADLKPTEPATQVTTGRIRAIASSGVAWVLVFGVLCAMGVPLARYHHGNGNILGDLTIPHWLAAHRTSGLNEVSQLGSTAGNTHAILFVGLIAGAIALAAIRRWRPVIFLVATMFGELTLFLASAAITGRQRPDVSHLDGQLPTSSFPSGHIAATICLYAAIAVLVMPRTRAWWRWLFIAVAVLMPLWVALSRVYRGMHHPTDALGSLILAACWLTAMVYCVRPNRDLDARATTTAAASSTEPKPKVGAPV